MNCEKINPQIIEEFHKWLPATVGPSTAKQYVRYVTYFLNWLEKEAFAPIDVDNYIAALRLKGTQNSSICTYQAAIKKFIRYCSKKNGTPYWGDDLDRIHVQEKPMADRYLTHEECVELVTAVQAKGRKTAVRDFCIICLYINTGLRKTELINLNLDDIFENGKYGYVVRVENGKGGKTRDIPIDADMVEILTTWYEERKRWVCKQDAKQALFLSQQGNRISVGAIDYLVRSSIPKTGITKKIATHDLRRTYATLHYHQSEASLPQLQGALGHDREVTTKRYIKATQRINREKIGKSLISGSDLHVEETE